MSPSSGSPLTVPATLDPREPAPNGIRFHQLLRDENLIPFLVGKIAAGRAPGQESGATAAGEFLQRWLQPWLQIGLEAAAEEAAWLEDLVQIAIRLIHLPAGRSPATVVDPAMTARWPEAPAWACLLAEDAGMTPLGRRVEVPVAFIFQSAPLAQPPTASDQVARLELRLVPGAGELQVHPADRWRRTVRQSVAGPDRKPASVDSPGVADPDFLGALTDALEAARAYLLETGVPVPLGAVIWRLLDFHADVPFRWQNSLHGASVGGAALRGLVRLWHPQPRPVEKYLFVLAQLRDPAGQKSATLHPVDGVRRKIEIAFEAVASRSRLLAHQTFFVLPRPPDSGDLPPEVGPEQVNGNFRHVAELAAARSPFDVTAREPAAPVLEREPAQKSKSSRSLFGLGLAAGVALVTMVIVVSGQHDPAKPAAPTVNEGVKSAPAKSETASADSPKADTPASPNDPVPPAPHGEGCIVASQPGGGFFLSYTLKQPGDPLNETRLSFKVSRAGSHFPPAWRSGPDPADQTGTWIWVGDGAQKGFAAMFLVSAHGVVVWAWLPPELATYFSADTPAS